MEIKYDENEEETETKRRDIFKSYFASIVVLGPNRSILNHFKSRVRTWLAKFEILLVKLI